ncbi:hypothetical protein [Chitinivorax sp. B]|uniref:hypothetical protein n=1 Tax=Chitinivorax sp. B TaxID=2502235 RepID=UPI0010F6CFC1|nr:hypothetical protein [Chitinivorax sp. B]
MLASILYSHRWLPVTLVWLAMPAVARDINVALGDVPQHDLWRQLIESMNQVAAPNRFVVQGVYPFKRSLSMLESGLIDAHVPIVELSRIQHEPVPYTYSTVTLFETVFVAYTRRDNADVLPGNMRYYRVETDPGHRDYFDFPVQPSASIESSLRKVAAGRIDAYVFSFRPVDEVLLRLKLSNIKRTRYAGFNVKFALRKDGNQAEVDRLISTAIGKLLANGRFDALLASVTANPYRDWQPWQLPQHSPQ